MDYIDYIALPWVMEVLIPQFFKMGIMILLFFYWIPSKIFPQIGMEDFQDKIMFNILYMIVYVETIIPLMLVMGIYSYPLFLMSLVFTKILMMKFYDKVVLHIYFLQLQNRTMTLILNILDDLPLFIATTKQRIRDGIREKIEAFSWKSFLIKTVIVAIFLYPAVLINLRGFFTFTYGASDTAQFFEWVSFLYKGQLFYEGKTFGADFYGMTVFAFFLSNLTNAPIHAVFSLYPFYTVTFLLFGLFYFMKKMTGSVAAGIFSVFIFGVVLMSPMVDFFLGRTYTTTNPTITNFFGLNLYLPWPIDLEKLSSGSVGMTPYTRNSCGLPYELGYTFFLPNIYFLIKSFASDERKYIWWYGITLMMMFTFHGGIAFYLIASSIPITLWALINGKLSLKKLGLGLVAVIFGAVAGNLWLLSIFKYGGLGPIGAAAPIIDATLQRLGIIQKGADKDIEFVPTADFDIEEQYILLPSHALLAFLGAVIVFFILAQFARKKRFEWSSAALVAAGVSFIFTATIFGVTKLVDATRAAEAMMLSWSIILGFYFYLLIVKPTSLLSKYSYIRVAYAAAALAGAIIIGWITPKWIDKTLFWKNLSGIEYTDFSYCAYKIKEDYQPFTWTVISYNPEYAEILTKGYHYNTQDFVVEYDPKDSFLRVPTPHIFIFTETRPHTYKGMEEWYYRWRGEIQENLRTWLMIYQMSHPGKLQVWYQSSHAVVYYINNEDYMKELFLEEKRKKELEMGDTFYKKNNFGKD